MRKLYTTHYDFKPWIIVPKHPLQYLEKFSFIPIKGNRILLFAKYKEIFNWSNYLHLSIHEICSDHRVGPALWSFNGGVASHFHIDDLVLINYTENALGITFGVRFDDHWKLFDISTTDASNNFPLIESGRIDFDKKLCSKWERKSSLCLSEIFMQSWTSSNVFFKLYYPLINAFSSTRIWTYTDATKRLPFTIWILVAQPFPLLPACLFPVPPNKDTFSLNQNLHFPPMGPSLLWLWVKAARECLFGIFKAKLH